MYGDSSANTPNINQLAKDGDCIKIVTQLHLFAHLVEAVLLLECIQQQLEHSICEHIKILSEKNAINSHNSLPYYSAKPKKPIRFFTEDLRAKGYYCTNNSKEDYNMITSPLAWDESSQNAHWRNRKENQPFFSVFNFNVTHESNIWKNKNNIPKKNWKMLKYHCFPK